MNKRVVVHAAQESGASGGGGEGQGQQVFQGMYGPWSIESSDKIEVRAYRAGLVTAATAFIVASSAAFLPHDAPLAAVLASALDPLYALGLSALGVSLLLIHIYVTPIKRALQSLWAIGALGSLALFFASVNGHEGAEGGLVRFVVDHPGAVWAVGPAFAALTGLVFKEGLCYGKIEAAALTFVIPTLLLGHLSGLMGEDVERVFLALWMALFTVFALRKFTQPIKDDIGDKSVFIFQALPIEKQEEILTKLKQRNGDTF